MNIIKFFLAIYFIIFQSISHAETNNFNEWKILFKKRAVSEGISIETINKIMDKAKFLPKVIKYDRYQPEFYEDTKTYINKRVNINKIKNGIDFYNNNSIIDDIEKKFSVEKELLLALFGIETNFGKYLGKMDIVSSLSTLSFD